MHTTNPKIEGHVWELCIKSLLFLKLQCSVLLQIWICDMFGAVHLLLHAIKQKNSELEKNA